MSLRVQFPSNQPVFGSKNTIIYQNGNINKNLLELTRIKTPVLMGGTLETSDTTRTDVFNRGKTSEQNITQDAGNDNRNSLDSN